jgi:hypothetical protein
MVDTRFNLRAIVPGGLPQGFVALAAQEDYGLNTG